MFGNLPALISAKLTDAAVHYRITARYLQSKVCHLYFTFFLSIPSRRYSAYPVEAEPHDPG